MYFNVKTQEHRCFVGCLTVVIHIRKWRLIACVVMVTSWRLFVMQNQACYPLRLKPYRYIQKYQTQLYICGSATSLCQGFFVVCVYMHINPDYIQWMIRSLNWVGQLWRHWPIVTSPKSCLMSGDVKMGQWRHNKCPWRKDVADRPMYNCVWYFVHIYMVWVIMDDIGYFAS